MLNFGTCVTIEKEKLEQNHSQIDMQSKEIQNLQNEFLRMKFDIAELLRISGKRSELNSNLSQYPTIQKHVKFDNNSDSVLVKDIDDSEIIL